MYDFFKFPFANLLVNTFLRSLVVIAVMILGLKTSWYQAYWGAIIHDAISLVIIHPLVR
jgi:hypothetical protein